MDVNSNIKWLIIKSGHRQAEVAKKMGYSVQTLNKWDRGDVYPRINDCHKLAGILGCSVNDLYWKDGENVQQKET
jgi:DNA-binding XRE family transcriptional regulator